MRERAVKASELSAAVGVSNNSVYAYSTGDTTPSVAVAQRLADALMEPMLVELARISQRRRCETCIRLFYRESTRRKFCSVACLKVAHKGGRRVETNPRQEAIDAMCGGCEPEGVCRDDTCALRQFSPLPFASLVRVAPLGDPALAAQRAQWRESWRRRQGAA
jgi:DNA-binding XRE family transcriptional regulator